MIILSSQSKQLFVLFITRSNKMILIKCIWREEDGLDNKPTYDTSFPISTQVITSTDYAFSQENTAHV